VTQGHIQDVITLFQTGAKQADPVMSSIVDTVTNNLATKFYISSDVARAVASQIVPVVMTQVIKKTNDPRDIDFDLQQMLRSMSGNNQLDISGMMPKQPKTTIGSISGVFSKLFKK
jgi:hypothetical protein